jgi:putative phosphoribosyl transferase
MGSLHIISDSGKPFFDRIEAGVDLGKFLVEYRGSSTVVLGIPRGGAVVAYEIAMALECEMDLVLAHKLGAPGNPELAIGAICENSDTFINKELAGYVGATAEYIRMEKQRRFEEMHERIKKYRAILAKTNLADKTVIVTDDGVATGATMKAALWAVRQERAAKIIAAIPVGPPDTLRTLAENADETICIRGPAHFGALGNFYLDFRQVSDEEMAHLLQIEKQRRDAKYKKHD